MSQYLAQQILTNQYADSFGFIEDEVKELLIAYGLEAKMEEMRKWYDGYRFGSCEIYNPWSILNYVGAAWKIRIRHHSHSGQIHPRTVL